MQFELWTLHCAQNVWRKRALAQLRTHHHEVGELKVGGKAGADEMGWLTRHCLSVFREPVNHDVSNSVPQRASTRDTITSSVAVQQRLIDETDVGSIEHILQLLAGHEPSAQEADVDAEERAQDVAQITAFGEEQEQQQEQEEEQEKEQQQQQQKEQEQEVEEPEVFAKEKYSRDDEQPKCWPLASLGEMPSPKRQGFYPASEFAVHRSFVEKRGGLQWPEEVQLSSDHTHPRWRFSSHRRLKNMILLMEWVPDVNALAIAAGSDATAAQKGSAALSDTQKQRLQRVFDMYDTTRDATQTHALNEAPLTLPPHTLITPYHHPLLTPSHHPLLTPPPHTPSPPPLCSSHLPHHHLLL